MTQSEERALIQRVLEGDADAFAPLVDSNRKTVYTLAYRITGNEQDALDLSQEAFLKAYTNLGSFRSDSRFSVWIYRITYNLCIDFQRKNKRHTVLSLTRPDADGTEQTPDIPDPTPGPEAVAERRERRMVIEAGLADLTAEHRQIFLMRELGGLSYSEIAETLHISEGTVKSRLARARRRLAAFLIESGTFPEKQRPIDDKEVTEHA